MLRVLSRTLAPTLARIVVPMLLATACSGSSSPGDSTIGIGSSPLVAPTQLDPGDVDGDGTADAVTVTPTAVEIQLSSGGAVSAPLTDLDTPKPVLSGFADVDGDHRYEVFVETARGPAVSFVQAYRYDGKTLSEVTAAGAPIRLGIGGTVTHGEGFSCPGKGSVVVRRAESLNGTGYTLRTRNYVLIGDVLYLRKEITVTAPSLDDERVAVAFEVDCGSVGDGGGSAD